MKQVLTVVFFFLSISFIIAQESAETNKKEKFDAMMETYMKTNKKSIDTAKPLIDFFLKYEAKDSSNAPNQYDFDLLLKEMGVLEEIENDKSGLTKEDAFQFINAYIKADKAIGNDTLPHSNSSEESMLNKEIKKAEEQFQDAMPGIEKMMKAAEQEAKKMNLQPDVISYDEFKKRAKLKKSNASEKEIKEAYSDLMKTLGRTN